MELKLTKHLQQLGRTCRSNCTFMELKYIQSIERNYRAAVLIVPLWN